MRSSSRYPYANSSFLEHINSFLINFTFITQLILLLTSYGTEETQRANTEVLSQNGFLRTE